MVPFYWMILSKESWKNQNSSVICLLNNTTIETKDVCCTWINPYSEIWIHLTDQIKLGTFKRPTKKFSRWWYFSLPLFSVFGFKARPVSMYVVSSRQSSITETMLERGAVEVLAPFAPRIWVVRKENRQSRNWIKILKRGLEYLIKTVNHLVLTFLILISTKIDRFGTIITYSKVSNIPIYFQNIFLSNNGFSPNKSVTYAQRHSNSHNFQKLPNYLNKFTI